MDTPVTPPDPSTAVLQRLSAAPFFAKSMTADTILSDMDDDTLVGLSLDAKTELLDCLYQRILIYPNKLNVVRVMASFGLEQQMSSWRQTVSQQLTHYITTDPDMRAARRDWPRLSDRKRLNVLAHIAAVHDSLGGFRSVPVGAFYAAGVGRGDNRRINLGWYRHNSGQIGINFHRDANPQSFDTIVGVLVHENTHNHQHQLARAWSRRRLTANMPEAPLARLFALNYRLSEELLTPGIFELYYHQPIEQHARALGFDVTRALARYRALEAMNNGPGRFIPPAPNLDRRNEIPQQWL